MVGFSICNYKIKHPTLLPNSQGDGKTIFMFFDIH